VQRQSLCPPEAILPDFQAIRVLVLFLQKKGSFLFSAATAVFWRCSGGNSSAG
jgi:hypothetical protein